MQAYPPPLRKVIALLSRLPGIGEKSATRLALFLLSRPQEELKSLAESIGGLKEKIRYCSQCFALTEEDPCPICQDPARGEEKVLCVVEEAGDLMAIEKAGIFKGKYHVLGGVLNPLEKIAPQDLRIEELLARLDRDGIEEVILATNPSLEGESTARYLKEVLAGKAVLVSRIALGLPMGGDIKYADDQTIGLAVASRREMV